MTEYRWGIRKGGSVAAKLQLLRAARCRLVLPPGACPWAAANSGTRPPREAAGPMVPSLPAPPANHTLGVGSQQHPRNPAHRQPLDPVPNNGQAAHEHRRPQAPRLHRLHQLKQVQGGAILCGRGAGQLCLWIGQKRVPRRRVAQARPPRAALTLGR